MLKRYAKALAAMALAWCSGTAYADQPAVAAGSCNPCPTACCEAPCCGGVYGSAGILFLRSCANGNPAYSNFLCVYENGLPTTHFTTITDFENGVDPGVRFELGWDSGCGYGARIRYFGWRSSNQIFQVDNLNDPGAGADGVVSRYNTASPLGIGFASVGTIADPSQLVFENRIKIQAWDLEATMNDKCGCLNLTWSAGVRYLQIAQEYNAAEALVFLPPTTAFPPGSAINQTLRSGHNLNGLGPIIGIEGRHTICDNLRIYGSGRAGLIFCEGGQQADYVANFNPEFQLPPFTQSASVERNRIVTTAEVEVGGEYALELSKCTELYIRSGLIGQAYFGVGNSSRSTIGGTPTEAKNDNLTLFGFQVTVGVRY